MQRRAVTALALTLAISGAPLGAQTSRTVPNADTPRLLVAVFASGERLVGVQVADAIRTRVQSGTNVRTLYVIPKNDITNYLESSGYKADSSLGPTDLRELAKLLRADEVLSGIVTRAPSGFRIEPRLMLARDVAFGQPLPTIEAANAGDAARQIERILNEARKQLPDNRLCENGVRDRQFDKAIAAAKAGILKYPNATIARLCLANAFQNMDAPPDSVLRVTTEVRRLDPKNTVALRMAYTAYKLKADTAARRGAADQATAQQENAVRALIELSRLEPTNQTLITQIVAELAKLGRPDRAIPIVDTLLQQNPGDPQLLRQKWIVTLAAAAADTGPRRNALFAQAVTAGEEMVRIDTTLADSTFFSRQIIAASAMTPPRSAEFAAHAVRRFPNSAFFWMQKADAERKAGQTQMAQQSLTRVLAIDPKFPNANLLMAQLHVELNQPDSAVAAARRAIAAGEDPSTWGRFLLSPTNALFKRAQETKNVAEFRRVLTLAQESERLASSREAKFFIGVAAYFIAADAVQQAQPLLEQAQKAKNNRTKNGLFARACPFSKEAQDMISLIQLNMPGGGSVDPGTAQAVLGWVAQASGAVDQYVKASCK